MPGHPGSRPLEDRNSHWFLALAVLARLSPALIHCIRRWGERRLTVRSVPTRPLRQYLANIRLDCSGLGRFLWIEQQSERTHWHLAIRMRSRRSCAWALVYLWREVPTIGSGEAPSLRIVGLCCRVGFPATHLSVVPGQRSFGRVFLVTGAIVSTEVHSFAPNRWIRNGDIAC